MKTTKILLSAVLAAFAVSPALANQSLPEAIPLSVLLGDIRSRIGADFILAPELAQDMISGTMLNQASPDDIKRLLEGYNYEVVHGQDGRISQVFISGRNGDGRQTRSDAGFASELLRYEAAPVPLPMKYMTLNDGAVAAVTIPVTRLNGMEKGEKIAMHLPTGDYLVVHDNTFTHENGDTTWVGYVEDAGTGYRVIITTGHEGSLGQIVTPEGTFKLDLEDGRNWLVDVGNSGLQSGSLAGDEVDGSQLEYSAANFAQDMPPDAPEYLSAKKAKKKVVKKKQAAKARSGTAKTGASSDVQVTIDVLVVYTKGMSTVGKVDTRLNFLVATANQAYIDSGIALQLRLVASIASDYPDRNQNSDALMDLTNGNGAFGGVAELRKQYGADLVALIRPFNYASQKNCGSGWVNGARGSELYAALGFSVVSDGTDPGGWYCSDYTFAHELGHNMGSVHDAANSAFEGKYPFSYGYGMEGKFGTIMSYINPAVGLFSSPRLTCKGEPCGNAASADNSRSISLTAPAVAGFMPARR